jgi:hypothetical protein
LTSVVLDSGILIASVFPKVLTPQAKRLIREFQADNTTLHAPTLLRYKAMAVLRKAVYQRRVDT